MCYIKTISFYYQSNMSPLISICHSLKILPGVKYFPKFEQHVLDIIQIACKKNSLEMRANYIRTWFANTLINYNFRSRRNYML